MFEDITRKTLIENLERAHTDKEKDQAFRELVEFENSLYEVDDFTGLIL